MYRPIHEAVLKVHDKGDCALKLMRAAGLNDWKDVTRARLEEMVDTGIEAGLARSSVALYLQIVKQACRRYGEEPEIDIPISAEALTAVSVPKGGRVLKAYLNQEEVQRLAKRAGARGELQEAVLNVWLVGARTGMRTSDILATSLANVEGEKLAYTSVKTGVPAVVPVRPGTVERIEWLQAHAAAVKSLSRQEMGKVIKTLCRRAGLTRTVTVHGADMTKQGELWQFVTMHTARISFCTNLARKGVPLADIAKMAGHTATSMTLRYIVPDAPVLNEAQLEYFDD